MVQDKDSQNQKRSKKATKELCADYVKEKNPREPEEKKVGTNFENILCRSEREKKLIRPAILFSFNVLMYYKTIIRFGFCDIQNDLGLN